MSEMIRYVKGQDPDRDAWLTNFFTENHLAYETFPDVVASPEQLKFIVHLEDEQIYYPCSDELFSRHHRETGGHGPDLGLHRHLDPAGKTGA